MDSGMDWHTARALLEWQVELGVVEAIADAPVDRFAVEEAAKEQAKARKAQGVAKRGPVPVVPEAKVDPVAEAVSAAKGAASLEALQAALGAFEHCELKRGARNLVFSDGVPDARVMIVGEAPGRDEDRIGKPFVGRAGQLLDRMLAAIGLSREESVYITNVMPWRPPQNRDPRPEEIAMLQPFLRKHIALVRPDVLVIMGNISCQALLGKRGITRLRGNWSEAEGIPAMPMLHPAYLLRTPSAKRETWADLLAVKARLEGK
ncbi:uracil-DNA glycosylase [Pacificoceanicola onchidii]|uniref:uracil-DNA glycosylase n=1 Tax=Pacificoceanicola onchidii TaxID=2562685 RepID=UPI0010A37C52|nr:uracil-DNA glycosylase [Pacificoceanicola onchidii]